MDGKNSGALLGSACQGAGGGQPVGTAVGGVEVAAVGVRSPAAVGFDESGDTPSSIMADVPPRRKEWPAYADVSRPG